MVSLLIHIYFRKEYSSEWEEEEEDEFEVYCRSGGEKSYIWKLLILLDCWIEDQHNQGIFYAFHQSHSSFLWHWVNGNCVAIIFANGLLWDELYLAASYTHKHHTITYRLESIGRVKKDSIVTEKLCIWCAHLSLITQQCSWSCWRSLLTPADGRINLLDLLLLYISTSNYYTRVPLL